ncbi:MAG: cell division protein FtsA [Armatimonadetes bacterium]|nr:cell division protein FtsA [Armatimonadota bacterium]
MAHDDHVVGIDIGTTKICTVVGRATEAGVLEVCGVGLHPSHGLRQGVVVDRQKTIVSIKESVGQAERMAGIEIGGAYVGISGDHITSTNATGRVHTGPAGEVTADDVDKAVQSARDSVSLTADREIIHSIVRDFAVDGQQGVARPIGMSGRRLDAEVHIVTGMASVIANISRCVEEAGVTVQQQVLEPLATSLAVLTEAERDLGVILVDIGGGTTDIAVFLDNSIYHTAAIAVAGNRVTRDLAKLLQISMEEAEAVKCRWGRALASAVPGDDEVLVTSADGESRRNVKQRLIAEVIQARLEEIFELVYADVKRSGAGDLCAGGVVLSGGGSQLPDTAKLASAVMGDMSVRVGKPRGLSGLVRNVSSPIHATGVGLAIQAALDGASTHSPKANDVWSRVKEWLQSVWRRTFPHTSS